MSLRLAQVGDYVDIKEYDDEEHEHDEGEHDEHEHDEHALNRFQFQTITIPHGSDHASFSVPTIDDDIIESDGRIIVFPIAVEVDDDDVPGSEKFIHDFLTPQQYRSAQAILKSDDLPVVTVSAQDAYPRTEGDDVVFQLERTGPMSWPQVSVRVQTSATGNLLFSSQITNAAIPENQISATHTVRTKDNIYDEAHGRVTLTVLDDDTDPAVYEVGLPNSATVNVLDNDPLDLRFNYPDDASMERVTIVDPIPVPQGGSVAYTLKLSKLPTSDVTVRIDSDNPDITIKPSQIIFSRAQTSQTLGTYNGMETSDSQESLLIVPWNQPISVNVIPKLGVISGTMTKLTHRLNCVLYGSDCGYISSDEYISIQVVPPRNSRPLISRIEPKIEDLTVSPGDEVVLTVNIFGRQNIQNQSLGTYLIEWYQGNDRITEYSGAQMKYTAPSAPGTYTVNARVAGDACTRGDDCSARFDIRVRRSSPSQSENEPATNPSGDIPSVIVDANGNQYEVFTPEQGGKFNNAERYSIVAQPGAVLNGEIVGIRMSESGSASNAGMTQHRYTLGGNSYTIHVVDASGNEINAYRLDEPAEVCIPLPNELRSNISKLALVALNNGDALTVHSARVWRIEPYGLSVCGNLSDLPATVAIGSQGTPAKIMSPTPEAYEGNLPNSGASAPPSNNAAMLLILGVLITILMSSTVFILSRAPRT